MKKVHNAAGKLVCIVTKKFTLEIVNNGCKTTITFIKDGSCKITSKYIKKE